MEREASIEDPCRSLAWDTEFWGFPIGQVRDHTLMPESLASIDLWCQENSIACLYFLAGFDDPDTIRTAEDGEFRLVDARVTLRRKLVQRERAALAADPTSVEIRSCLAADITLLQRIAAESHRDTRFYFDLYFPRAKCELLYERWIAQSCAGFADQVLIAESNSYVLGYVTCHLPAGSEMAGRIGLVGVAAHNRGRGIGTQLVLRALDWFAGQGVETVTVVTQGRNIGAQSLYQRCGFIIQSHQLWYHKWYRLPDLAST